MINTGNNEARSEHSYQKTVVLLMFFIGALNASRYFEYMGLDIINKGILFAFYSILVLMFMIIVISYLYRKEIYAYSAFHYWGVLFISIGIKFFILFIQFPSSFLPEGENFSIFITLSRNFLLILIIVTSIRNMYYIRASVWALGLGASLAAIIPLLFFPEMIGSRVSSIDGYSFYGAFWNSSVVSYMSVGWLLVALTAYETSKLKRNILFGLFILMVIGGLAGLSRAIFVSLIISIIVYLIASNSFRRYLKVIIVSVGLLLFLFNFFQDEIDNFTQRFDGGIDIEDEARTTIWKDYIKGLPDYILLGELEGNYKKYSVTGHGPHSVLLNWLTHFGILGLLGFGILLLGVVKSIKVIIKFQSKYVGAGLYAWLVAYLSIAMINETGFSQLTVFGGIGIILAWGNVVRKAATKSDIEI